MKLSKLRIKIVPIQTLNTVTLKYIFFNSCETYNSKTANILYCKLYSELNFIKESRKKKIKKNRKSVISHLIFFSVGFSKAAKIKKLKFTVAIYQDYRHQTRHYKTTCVLCTSSCVTHRQKERNNERER